MITIITIIVYVGGLIGMLRNAPSNSPSGSVVLSAILWPGAIVCVLVERFMYHNTKWMDNTDGPVFKK